MVEPGARRDRPRTRALLAVAGAGAGVVVLAAGLHAGLRSDAEPLTRGPASSASSSASASASGAASSGAPAAPASAARASAAVPAVAVRPSHRAAAGPTRVHAARPTASAAPSSASPTRSATTRRAAPSAVPSSDPGAGQAERPFSASSPWNTPIPAGAAVDPASSAIRDAVLTDPKLVVNVETYSYAIPFYTATASTPRVRLNGRADQGALVPIDPSWTPNEGGDHKMNVIDPAQHRVYELQGYDRAARSAFWMVVRDYRDGSGDGLPVDGRSGPSGAGVSQAAGIIRLSDVRAGRIDHALSFVTSAPVSGRFRYPATSTDGTSEAANGVQEGMRVQLDPALDLDSIKGLTPAERMIATALQRYGAFCVDNGGGNNQAMGFYAEQPTAGSGDPYPAAGLHGDWVQLPHIPRSALRVVAAEVTSR